MYPDEVYSADDSAIRRPTFYTKFFQDNPRSQDGIRNTKDLKNFMG
jgi:hypothetical protein